MADEKTIADTKTKAPQKSAEELAVEVQELQARLAESEGYGADGSTDELTVIPKKWVEAVHTILGPEFECELSQPDNGGTLFKVIVPRELSNASQLHWQVHSRDVRTKNIGSTGLTGVTEWCQRIRTNLLASGKTLIQYP